MKENRRRLSIVTALLLVFGPMTLSSLAHAGERTIRSKSRFVGNGVNQVALQVADGTNVGQAVPGRSQGTGTWGKSVSDSLLQWELDAGTFSPDCFEGGFGLIFPIVQFDFQTTFPSDLSSYHGNLIEGELCVNLDDVTQVLFWIESNVVGGTGRFAGATGRVRSEGKSQALPPGRFSVNQGTSVTTLTLP